MRKVFIFFLGLNIFINVTGQVNHQTGSAIFNLPLFNWQDDKSRLNTFISLNYNSGNGLKVNDVASNVGQGWNLIAGGVITRMQVGEPDDQKPFFQGSTESSYDTKKYPPGYLYASFDITKGVSNSITRYPIFRDRNILYKQYNDVAADKELDRFAFQFNGRTGIFILDKNTNQGMSLGDNKLKISFVRNENMASQQIRTTIISFKIQDENGLIFKFTKYGTTKVLKTEYCNADLNGKLTQPKFESGKVYNETGFEDAQIANPNIINEWHLEEIEDALTQRKINLTYFIRSVDAKAGKAITQYEDFGVKDYCIISHLKSKTQTPEISTISYPDGHQVNFNYGKDRLDLIGEKALASVDIKYFGRFISKYEFNTSYFILNRIGTPNSDFQKSVARLCLRSVKKSGVDLKGDEPPYMFDYYVGSNNTDDIVPAPFSHLKDIWGFYNGDYSRNFYNGTLSLTKSISALTNSELKGLCFLRSGSTDVALNAKPGYARNGLIKQISYPTGGALKYEYEQNTAVLVGQSVNNNVGGVHVSRTSVTDGGYSNDCSNALYTNYTYGSDPSNTQSSLWGLEIPKNSITVNSYYNPESRYVYYKPIANVGCKYRYQFPGILSREQAVDLTGHQKFLQTLSEVMEVVSGVMQVFDIVSVCLSATPAAIIAIILDVIGVIVNIVITCFSDFSKNSVMIMYYNSDINGSNPLPSQFRRVEITESSGGNGKTVMEFTNPQDYPVWEPTNPSFSMQQRYAPWAYGLPKKVSVYNSNNNLVKQTENTYDYSKAKTPYGYWQTDKYGNPPFYVYGYANCKFLTLSNNSQRSDEWLSPVNYQYPSTYINASNSNVNIKLYDIYRGRCELSGTIERVFKDNDPTKFLTTSSTFNYNINNYQVSKITSTKSNGDTEFKEITYSIDYNLGILEVLNQNNIIAEPVETANGFSSPGNNIGNVYIGENVTEFTTLSNGNIRPLRTLEQRFTQHQAYMNRYIYPGSTSNPVYKETQSFIYDISTSNLIGIKDEGNRVISNIYDYNNRYVIATVVNAHPIVDKFAYTSFETSGLGGWSLNGAANYDNNNITGARSLLLSPGNSLTATLNVSKPSRLSFWSINAVSVSSGVLIKSSPVINGYTYYEYNISQGTSAITITGNSTIDELRVYPQTSRMKTITYDPLIGKTAECDENNRITYYEYDELGRLRFIKDDKRNVIKMYEYNVAKKPVCPVTYTNLIVSEMYTKNDCPLGYVGSNVIYTIPANTYFSTYSQEAVDHQVEDDLNSNGQNYANSNGSCLLVYLNVSLSANFTKENCPLGYIGTTITYTVPAGKYSSLTNQADANQQAQEEIDANGQAYANAEGNASCVINNDAVWEGTGLEQCTNGHKFKQVKDINPNSSTYNQTQWIDFGVDPTCSQGCSNCTAQSQRCINGVCEVGIKVYENVHGHCWYHYEWSDGFWSQNYPVPGCIYEDE